jgi:hypothetical protein
MIGAGVSTKVGKQASGEEMRITGSTRTCRRSRARSTSSGGSRQWLTGGSSTAAGATVLTSGGLWGQAMGALALAMESNGGKERD